MLIKNIHRNKIIEEVKRELLNAKKEILVTMLLKEEVENPLPLSYHSLLQKKTREGICLVRLGFGLKEEYNYLSKKYSYGNNYTFIFIKDIRKYQRMIIIDDSVVYFKIGKSFFKTNNAFVVKAFRSYFNSLRMKGKNG